MNYIGAFFIALFCCNGCAADNAGFLASDDAGDAGGARVGGVDAEAGRDTAGVGEMGAPGAVSCERIDWCGGSCPMSSGWCANYQGTNFIKSFKFIRDADGKFSVAWEVSAPVDNVLFEPHRGDCDLEMYPCEKYSSDGTGGVFVRPVKESLVKSTAYRIYARKGKAEYATATAQVWIK